jgi:signal transduction histidine kinase
MAPVSAGERRASPARANNGLRDLLGTRLCVSAEEPVARVVHLFEQHPEADSLAVLDGPRVLQIVRARFYLQLGRRFGYALFEHRPARLLAEEGSTVDAEADPVEVITLATQRDPARVHDDLLVVEGDGSFAGTLSMRALMVHHKHLLTASLAEVTLLDEKNRRLEALRQVQAEFLANMTHELRAPLHAMLGSLQVLADDPDTHARYEQSLRQIGARAREVLTIVDNVLDLARVDADALEALVEDTPLEPLLQEALVALEPTVGARPLRLELRLVGLERPFRTDPVFVRRIVTNLLSNAIKFTAHGSVVLGASVDAGWLTLHVSDTGPGIAESDLERLFTRFTQLESTRRKRHAGSGLGLAIVKALCEALGGNVSVMTRLGAGSTFTVRLPWGGLQRAEEG